MKSKITAKYDLYDLPYQGEVSKLIIDCLKRARAAHGQEISLDRTLKSVAKFSSSGKLIEVSVIPDSDENPDIQVVEALDEEAPPKDYALRVVRIRGHALGDVTFTQLSKYMSRLPGSIFTADVLEGKLRAARDTDLQQWHKLLHDKMTQQMDSATPDRQYVLSALALIAGCSGLRNLMKTAHLHLELPGSAEIMPNDLKLVSNGALSPSLVTTMLAMASTNDEALNSPELHARLMRMFSEHYKEKDDSIAARSENAQLGEYSDLVHQFRALLNLGMQHCRLDERKLFEEIRGSATQNIAAFGRFRGNTQPEEPELEKNNPYSRMRWPTPQQFEKIIELFQADSNQPKPDASLTRQHNQKEVETKNWWNLPVKIHLQSNKDVRWKNFGEAFLELYGPATEARRGLIEAAEKAAREAAERVAAEKAAKEAAARAEAEAGATSDPAEQVDGDAGPGGVAAAVVARRDGPDLGPTPGK